MEVEGRESIVFRDGERRQYEESKKVFWDNYSVMKMAIKKSLAQGREEGCEEEKLNTARKMKADGMTVELIEKYTGLSAEDIEKL